MQPLSSASNTHEPGGLLAGGPRWWPLATFLDRAEQRPIWDSQCPPHLGCRRTTQTTQRNKAQRDTAAWPRFRVSSGHVSCYACPPFRQRTYSIVARTPILAMDPEAWSVVDIERPSASASPSLWRPVNSVLSMAYADCLLKKLKLNKVLLDLKGSSTLAGWKLDTSPVFLLIQPVPQGPPPGHSSSLAAHFPLRLDRPRLSPAALCKPTPAAKPAAHSRLAEAVHPRPFITRTNGAFHTERIAAITHKATSLHSPLVARNGDELSTLAVQASTACSRRPLTVYHGLDTAGSTDLELMDAAPPEAIGLRHSQVFDRRALCMSQPTGDPPFRQFENSSLVHSSHRVAGIIRSAKRRCDVGNDQLGARAGCAATVGISRGVRCWPTLHRLFAMPRYYYTLSVFRALFPLITDAMSEVEVLSTPV
ncbi:hypothetical protein EDB80DRAFT_811034 [Ilyonectria destructans]|nr:hypothetical protein EDB80DRAFT_811034 [Ilyonectria destructans]